MSLNTLTTGLKINLDNHMLCSLFFFSLDFFNRQKFESHALQQFLSCMFLLGLGLEIFNLSELFSWFNKRYINTWIIF